MKQHDMMQKQSSLRYHTDASVYCDPLQAEKLVKVGWSCPHVPLEGACLLSDYLPDASAADANIQPGAAAELQYRRKPLPQ